jgi:hypothetical protein
MNQKKPNDSTTAPTTAAVIVKKPIQRTKPDNIVSR